MGREYTSEDYKNAIRNLFHKDSFYSTNVMCTCPFHSDRQPSLSISWKTGEYQCFQCKRSGHLSKLTYEIPWCQKSIAELLHLGIDENAFDNAIKTQERIQEDTKPREVSISVIGVKTPFKDSIEAHNYFLSRGIDPLLADGRDIFYLSEGIVNNTPVRERLCFPIYEQGKLVNLEMRDVTRKQLKKCMYPIGSIKPLFEYEKLDKTQPVFLFEGLIKMLVAQSDPFFKNATTSFGSQLSGYQLQLLNLFPEVIIIPDNDKAGTAMCNYLRAAYKGKLSVWRIGNPQINDIDEIPEKLGLTIKEYRETIGFNSDFL